MCISLAPIRSCPTSPPGWRWSHGAIFGDSRGWWKHSWSGCTCRVRLVARPVEIALFAPGRAAELLLGDTHLGYLGEIDDEQLKVFELRQACGAVELEFDVLLSRANLVAQTSSAAAIPDGGPRPLTRRSARVAVGGAMRHSDPDRGHAPWRQSSIWISSRGETSRTTSRASISV